VPAMAVGTAKARFRDAPLVFRHPKRGPTAMRSSSVRPRGTIHRLKNGGPTVTVSFQSHSLMRGKIVAIRMNDMMPSRSQLLTTNTASRLSTASICPRLRSCGRRYTMSPTLTARASPMNQRKKTPMSLCANACTLEMRPARVRNVPKIVSRNVITMRTTFQIFSMLRRSWIIVECTNALAVNQGKHAAFSTGSHAQ